MIRYRGKAGHHEVHKPANTDAERTAYPVQVVCQMWIYAF